jgi:hypothetical protein
MLLTGQTLRRLSKAALDPSGLFLFNADSASHAAPGGSHRRVEERHVTADATDELEFAYHYGDALSVYRCLVHVLSPKSVSHRKQCGGKVMALTSKPMMIKASLASCRTAITWL